MKATRPALTIPKLDQYVNQLRALQAADVGMCARVMTLEAELSDERHALRSEIAAQVGAERTHRLKLAEDQRVYVDQLHGVAKESALRLNARLVEFRDRGFWGRLRWLLVGR